MADLLIELFSEEIPAGMQARARADLQRMVTDGLVEAGLTYGSAAAFSTPRRLALAVDGLSARSPDTREERKGPKVGAPDKAIEGFLRGAGVAREDLEIRDTGKGEVYFATIERKGRAAPEIIAEVLEATIRSFPWPKSMRWGAGSLRWVRPLHAIICLLSDENGAEVVPLEVEGIRTGRETRGHRVHSSGDLSVASFEDYEAQLKRAHVLLRHEERAEIIRSEAANLAFAQGYELVEDPGLLAEVAGLVEWPVVLMGEIGADFLDLPPEVLVTSMKEHQKFFSLKAAKTGRIERFITVANLEPADGGARILAGNQKVLAARLADAKFFWENDLRVARAGMLPWLEALENVTFQSDLGSQRARIRRIADLAETLAPHTGAAPEMARRAAEIAKADLSSEMVYEFPELQGLMGRYYAAEAGLDPAIAEAAEAHYAPLGPTDAVPTAPVSIAVALADKLDTLTGFWAIDQKPTGSKDPYALRRAALGVIRLVLSNDLRLPLLSLMEGQIAAHQSALGKPADPAIAADLLSFTHDRLKVHLKSEGIRHDVIDACLAMARADDLSLLVRRAHALQAFLDTEDGENLVQGFRRANNILSQAEAADGVEYSYGAEVKFAETPEEKTLFAALSEAAPRIEAATQSEDFAAAMAALAGLRAPIDSFFEAVQINDGRDVIRRNRLNMLHQIRALCAGVADLTRIAG